MKQITTILISSLFAMLLITSCGENVKEKEKSVINTQDIQPDILGIYHAIAPHYNMKNKFGDDMIINGKTISIPSIDHKFILEKNGLVSLQQTNTDDNTRYYYKGTFFIIDENGEEWQKVKCSLSDGESSNPTFILTIYPLLNTALCQTDNAPELTLKKIK